MFPITTGLIPFGAVMGSVSANAKLTLFETMAMNVFVYAGAAQLAVIDLMTKDAFTIVILATGLVINLRFLLYSAAMSPILRNYGFWTKVTGAYFLTDQTYASMSANQDSLKNSAETLQFYFGTSLCMYIAWQGAVAAGFIFGNFAPPSIALDYAVPLSFIALLIPTLKNSKYVTIAAFSAIVSILLNSLPYKSGLIVTALLSIGFGALLTRGKSLS